MVYLGGVCACLLSAGCTSVRVSDEDYARIDALNREGITWRGETEKEKRLCVEFLSDQEISSQNADLLLYSPVLSWRVHSLAIAYDLDGRYESIVSRERLAGAKSTQMRDSKDEMTLSFGRTSVGEASGSLQAEAGLVFGIFPKLTVNADGAMRKTASKTSSSGMSSAWTRQDQFALNSNYENVTRELGETKLSGLHIRFVIEFTNATEKDMIVPRGSTVPVYAGSSLSVTATMESSTDLNIPAYATVDIPFRGDIATTAARELIDFMRTATPTISPERSPLLVIHSVDGAISNAVNDSRRIAYSTIVCGAYSWKVRKSWNGRPVTMQQALAAVNSQYDVAPFVWDENQLREICGAKVSNFDLSQIPCVETGDGISIGWGDLSKPMVDDSFALGVMKVDDFIGEGRGWDRLTKKGQESLVSRLRELDGQKEAQFWLGCCYVLGYGVDRSEEKAVKLYRKAAEQGYAEATALLGLCYGQGFGVAQSWIEAVKWYRKAAEQGNADAQFELGQCYAKGNGVERSWEEAVRWYRKAAEQGNATAQVVLGWCYAEGKGVAQSWTEAVRWYRKAAEQGDATAQFNLGCCYAEGKGVEQSWTEAVKWQRKAAEQGDATAQHNLAWCYGKGRGVGQSWTEAKKWLRLSAQNGYKLSDGERKFIDEN